MEKVDEYVVKLVQLPLTSIVEDASLDFNLKDNSYLTLGGATTLKTRFLQLKVRAAYILKSLAQAPMPNAYLTAFLLSLLEDGKYFPENYFWPGEREKLEFDKLVHATLHLCN